VAHDAEAEVVGEGWGGGWRLEAGDWRGGVGRYYELDFVGVGQKRGDFVLMRGVASAARERRAIERHARFGGESGADEPEGIVFFEARGPMKDARPARGAGCEAVALPRVAKPEGVGEKHESGWRLET
jgi:hypothetical protein